MSGEEAPVAQQQQDQTPDEPPSGSESGMQRSHPGQQEAAAALTSRALVLTGHGGYDKIRLQVRTARADPGSGEVLVRVRACGLNFADLMGRQGLYEPLPGPPVIMGMEGSGVVQAVGEGVADRKVGDRVLMLSPSGLWQELAVVAADHTFLMPDAMSFEEAAALPVNYLTAHMMLFQMGNLRPGKSILIHMAAGGVGTAATQLCRTVPDVTVFGTASASKHESIVQGGVNHPIDYRTKDYVEEIRKISPKGVDIVLDPLGGSDTQKGFGLLKPLGSIIVFGAANCVTGQKKNLLALAKTWYNQLSISTLKLMQANRAVCGFHLGFLSDHQLIASTMSTLMELYTQGKIQPRIDSTFHFEQVGDAMRRMHDRLNVGKVILLPEPERKEDAATEPKRNAAPEENTTEAAVAAEGKEEEQKKEEGEAGLEGGVEELKD